MNNTKLVKELLQHTGNSNDVGFIATFNENVFLFRAIEETDSIPLLYEQGLIFIFQGHKIISVGQNKIRYDQDRLLVVTSPSPLYCRTVASKKKPLLGVFVKLDLTVLYELIGKLQISSNFSVANQKESLKRIVSTVAVEEELSHAIFRLLKCLFEKENAEVLSPSIVREILYYVLRSQAGTSLMALARNDGSFFKISKVLNYIHSNYNKPLSVDDLIVRAGMSNASFHRVFKKIVSDSPIQYIKKIRLLKAKELLTSTEEKANSVAFKVGYESPSQFSREYKRYFGYSPGNTPSSLD